MEYRQLGGSGFKVPVLTLGTGTFGGSGPLFKAFGGNEVKEATRLVDVCLEAGLTMFDSADYKLQPPAAAMPPPSAPQPTPTPTSNAPWPIPLTRSPLPAFAL
jgi:hypothetical protein